MDAKVLDTGTVDGTQVGAPIGVANFSIAVNPTVLEKAGVAMPDDKTWTWDDLAEISAQVTEKLGGRGGLRHRRLRRRCRRAGHLGAPEG